ncbi:hypothetical protein OQA88_7303 [Cercophora sp. LCS_1]
MQLPSVSSPTSFLARAHRYLRKPTMTNSLPHLNSTSMRSSQNSMVRDAVERQIEPGKESPVPARKSQGLNKKRLPLNFTNRSYELQRWKHEEVYYQSELTLALHAGGDFSGFANPDEDWAKISLLVWFPPRQVAVPASRLLHLIRLFYPPAFPQLIAWATSVAPGLANIITTFAFVAIIVAALTLVQRLQLGLALLFNFWWCASCRPFVGGWHVYISVV